MDGSSRTRSRLLAPLAACVAAVVAVSVAAPSDNFVDRALPLYALAFAIVALLEGRRFGDAPLALALPLLAVARVAVHDENLRILVYGVVLASSVTIFAARTLARHGELTVVEGLALTGVCVAAMKLVPLSPPLAPAQAVAIAGSLILVASLAGRRGIDAGALLVAIAAGIVTPLDPLKGSLFPLLLAAALWALRGPSPFSIAALVGCSALAGRWSWPLAALVVAALLLEEIVDAARARRSAPAALVAAIPAGSLAPGTGALAAAAFAPESIASFARLTLSARAGAAALAATGLVLRPALGTLYMLGALAVLLSSAAREERGEGPVTKPIPLVATALVAAMIALAGYSGAVVSRFPLPLPLASVALVALVALAAWPVRRAPALAIVLSTSLLVAAVALLHGGVTAGASRVVAVLAPGQTYEAGIEAADALRVELAGGNLAGLAPGEVVATVEAFDAEGRVARREVTIGEIADWGFGRPGHYFAARNEWPLVTGAKIAEYGSEAFFGGSGTIEVAFPRSVRLRVTASPALPASGRINVDAVGVVRR